MDRGVKIAIFAASIISLALGLVWDRVLSQARVMVEKPVEDPMGPERMNASVGAPNLPRLELVQKVDAAVEAAPPELTGPAPAVTPAPVPQPDAAELEYEIQQGDSWWSLANRRFKDRGWTSTELEKHNAGAKLVPGRKIRIPAAKKPQ
ncbi:MAG: LysM peptidoglycan-binding domain-containing protein [Planctomycetes bacterium]|jgi:hypothetical protein|nr:LysM peptidoglycan-binding domain-containing protein [Planctomycetota bacterium]MCL4730873.1 LysM domain-containing protein [Planctomycetota bacterium]